MKKLYGLSGSAGNSRLSSRRKDRPRGTVGSARVKMESMRFSHRLARPAVSEAIAMVVPAATAAPIPARFPEGVTHGFLALRTTEGKTIARGDLLQLPRGDTVETRLVLRFQDGSLHDETVVFSQEKVFRMLSYHIVQKGPSFPFEIDASVDRSGSYTVLSRKPKEDTETDKGKLDLPPDVYNG